MKRILLLIVIILTTGQVIAQDETPEFPIQAGFVFKWEQEIIFPEGVRFRLTLSRSIDDLTAASLMIEPAGRSAIRVDMDLAEPVATGPNFTEFSFMWTFPDGFAPRLFQADDVLFEWRAEDGQGETALVRDALFFTDPRVQWVQDEDPQGFLNLTVPEDELATGQIRQSMRLPYNLMAANVGRNRSFDIILYPDYLDPSACKLIEDEDSGQAVVVALGPGGLAKLPCDPSQATTIFTASGMSAVQSRGTSLNSAQTVLIEFLTREFYGPIWAGAVVPDWFAAGLTQFYLPTSKARWLLPTRDTARTNRLRSLDDMADGTDADDAWRAQSYAMVVYIADQIGVDALFDLANDVGSASSFAEAYTRAVGQDYDSLLPSLSRWIFNDAATSAFNYTPYLAETPVPTESRTPSPFPPTATFTPTATVTPTFTPSVTGVLSPTPTLTFTPSRTPTARPPTVTPRPAGSLNTPTPTPVPGLLDNPVNRLGVITVLLVLAAIVGLAYLRTGRRDA